jgi:flagellar motor switch protein FliN
MNEPHAEGQSGPGEQTAENAGASEASVVAKVADFAALTGTAASGPASSLDRLLDLSVPVTAELGRVTVSIGDILKLGVGSVLELDRPVSEPVDLMVQDVQLARGEVVVVEDRFAIRIKEIVDPKKKVA